MRFLEAFHNEVSWFFSGFINSYSLLIKYRKKLLIISIMIIYFLSEFYQFDNVKIFKYGLIKLNLAGSFIFLFFFLYLLNI